MTEDKYKEIRRLTEMWYDGLTGPVQQSQLVRFFAEADITQLPDDLKAEAEVFRCIGDLSQQCPDTALTAEIDAAAKAEKRRRLWHRLAVWSTAVASAAVIVFAIGAGLRISTATLDAPAEMTALPAKPVAKAGQDKPVQEYKAEETSEIITPAPAPAGKAVTAKTAVAKRATKQNEVPEGFTEITDTATVIRIMQDLNRQNSKLFAESSSAIEEARMTFGDTALETFEIAKSIIF